MLIIDEPTYSLDVGAKAEIHCFIDELPAKGAGVLLSTRELLEVINLFTRILSLRDGHIVGEVSRAQASQ